METPAIRVAGKTGLRSATCSSTHQPCGTVLLSQIEPPCREEGCNGALATAHPRVLFKSLIGSKRINEPSSWHTITGRMEIVRRFGRKSICRIVRSSLSFLLHKKKLAPVGALVP